MRAALFIGPSLDPEVVQSRFAGEVHPPIKRGDLDALVGGPSPPRLVGIVDGQFLQALAISPKEVVRALDRGVRVYGASSMGALRAAECEPFGMIGIGRIFAMYAGGELDADDEVAIVFGADDLRALSEPMVNIRIAVQAAVDAGVVSVATGAAATAVAKALYFPSRTYANMLRSLAGDVPEAERAALAAFLRRPEAPDQKRSDALELIAAMQSADGEQG